MNEPNPSFFARIPMAVGAFFKTLFNAEYAASIRRLDQSAALGVEHGVAEPAAVSPLKEMSADSALQFLGLLQRDGRFVDFIEEDTSAYTDTEIGAAARVVHEGCRKVLREHISLEPVRTEQEGARVTVEQGFDASATRLTGNVVGQPPFTGTLTHRGWRASDVNLPKIAKEHDVTVLAPAEVEL